MPQFVWAIVVLIASQVIGSFLAQGQSAKPPAPATFDDFDVPQIEEDTPMAVVFGDVWIEGWQVLWYGNYYNSPIMSSGGGKK